MIQEILVLLDLLVNRDSEVFKVIPVGRVIKVTKVIQVLPDILDR